MEIKCPECEVDGTFSLVQSKYHGPYRCWKCKELFTILIENNELKSCEPLSPEEFQKQQEMAEARKNEARRSQSE